MFLDPGTDPAPEFLRRVVNEQLRLGGLLSVAPYRRMRRIRDRLAAFVDLVTVMAVGGVDATPTGGRVTGAFGACMVCSRADFLSVTGNAELRSIPWLSRAGAPLCGRGADRARPARSRRGGARIRRAGHGARRLDERAREPGGRVCAPMPAGRAVGIAPVGGRPADRDVRAGVRARRPVVLAAAVPRVRRSRLGVLLRRVGNYGADRGAVSAPVARVPRYAGVVAGAADAPTRAAVIQSATTCVATSRPSSAGKP